MFLGGTCQEYYLASAWVERMYDVRLDASDIKMRSPEYTTSYECAHDAS